VQATHLLSEGRDYSDILGGHGTRSQALALYEVAAHLHHRCDLKQQCVRNEVSQYTG
jgi:hypothetical protein